MAAPFVAGEVAHKALDNPENPTPVDQIEQLVQSGVTVNAKIRPLSASLERERQTSGSLLQLKKGNGELKLKKAVYLNTKAKTGFACGRFIRA